MKLKPLLLTAAAAFSLQANAQTWVSDSVSTTPGYANDVYYSMANGSVSAVPNTNWHFGFQMVPQAGPSSTAGIIANHVMGKVSVYSINKQATGHFTTLTAGDTVGKMGNALYNSDTAWGFGAFNQNHNPANLFDYGWGQYNQTTHFLNGDSIYIVKVDTVVYKVWMQEYVTYPNDSISWNFRIAKFDNTDDTTILMPRHKNGFDFTNRQFGYYNVTTHTILDREPGRDAWDILFTRYMDSASQGPMFLPHYPAAGVFSNMNTMVAEVHHINPDTAGTSQNYSANTNEIGYDWKHYDQATNTWGIDSTVYFIKTGGNSYYQMQFTGFGGAATGKYYFRKRQLTPTAVKNMSVNNVNALAIVPNPAQNQTAVMIDAKENIGTAHIMIADLNGRLVQHYAVTVNKGMNGFAINTAAVPAGIYMVTVTNGSWKVTEKLMVQH